MFMEPVLPFGNVNTRTKVFEIFICTMYNNVDEEIFTFGVKESRLINVMMQ